MTRYEAAIDLARSRRSTCTCTSRSTAHGHTSLPPTLAEAASKYFSDRRAPARPRQRRRLLSRAADGSGGVHGRRHARVSGTPRSPAPRSPSGAARHNDVLIPFGSVDPLGGAAAHGCGPSTRGADRGVRGFKFHPTVQGFDPATRSTIRCTVRSRSSVCRRSSTPGRPESARGCRAAADSSSGCRTRCCSTDRGGLPRAADHPGPPVGALAGRGDLRRDPQGQRVDRPVRLEPQVLPGISSCGPRTRTCRTGAVRLGLPAAYP